MKKPICFILVFALIMSLFCFALPMTASAVDYYKQYSTGLVSDSASVGLWQNYVSPSNLTLLEESYIVLFDGAKLSTVREDYSTFGVFSEVLHNFFKFTGGYGSVTLDDLQSAKIALNQYFSKFIGSPLGESILYKFGILDDGHIFADIAFDVDLGVYRLIFFVPGIWAVDPVNGHFPYYKPPDATTHKPDADQAGQTVIIDQSQTKYISSDSPLYCFLPAAQTLDKPFIVDQIEFKNAETLYTNYIRKILDYNGSKYIALYCASIGYYLCINDGSKRPIVVEYVSAEKAASTNLSDYELILYNDLDWSDYRVVSDPDLWRSLQAQFDAMGFFDAIHGEQCPYMHLSHLNADRTVKYAVVVAGTEHPVVYANSANRAYVSNNLNWFVTPESIPNKLDIYSQTEFQILYDTLISNSANGIAGLDKYSIAYVNTENYGTVGFLTDRRFSGNVLSWEEFTSAAVGVVWYSFLEYGSLFCFQLNPGENYDINSYKNYYTDGDVHTYSNGDVVNVFDGGTYAEHQLVNIDNSTAVNISGGLGGIDDSITLFLQNLVYDMDTKTYSASTRSYYQYDDQLNNYFYVSYDYEFNFYVDYTSVTYIGTTAEANETYHFYYELPDGRSSADLSAEDLLYLNTSLDCCTYDRGTDDVSLRSLYHFNGDTRDASYWNYCTEFNWIENASLTYMDAGENFQGALYLDELRHEFDVVLPSSLGSGDFTLEFRYYTSRTLTASADTYIQCNNQKLIYMTGNKFLNGSGTIIGDCSVGSWVAVCVMRMYGYVYIYANGVLLGQYLDGNIYDDTLTFVFGSDQQTYKYFDELRVLNYALYERNGNAYQRYNPSAIAYDTNLTLVLPGTSVPVADEYWDIQNPDQTNLLSEYGLDWWDGRADCGVFSSRYRNLALLGSNVVYGYPYINCVSSVQSLGSLFLPSNGVFVSNYYTDYYNGNRCSFYCYTGELLFYLGRSELDAKYLPYGSYCFSVVLDNGEVLTVPFQWKAYSNYNNPIEIPLLASSGYQISLFVSRNMASHLSVRRTSEDSSGILYMELVDGEHTSLSVEYVTSITPMDIDSIEKPMLAVRTDTNITSWNIGGVRPSVPKLGMCWCIVEDGIIKSIQVYNGYGWTECDARIWTGSRWVPYSSYNIVTLNDLFDVIGSDPTYTPVYSDTGFWAWFQRAWNEFIQLVRNIYAAVTRLGSPAGGDGVGGTEDLENPVLPSDDSDTDASGLLDIIKTVFNGVTKIIVGSVDALANGVAGLVSRVSDLGSFFALYDPENQNGVYFYPLEPEITMAPG